MRTPLAGLVVALMLCAGAPFARAQSVTVVLTQIEGKESGNRYVDPALKPIQSLLEKNAVYKVYKQLRMLAQQRKTTTLGSALSFDLPAGYRCELRASASKKAGFVHIDCDVISPEKPPKVTHVSADLKDGGTTFVRPPQPKDLVLGITVQTEAK